MKVLVTGGAGFIGSSVAKRYLDQGMEVVIVDNLSTGKKTNVPSEAPFYRTGIEKDSLQEIFEKEKPDIVNHHAAQIDVRKSVEDPCSDANINIIGSIKLFDQCVKHKVKKIIFASSGGAGYGEQQRFPADEEHPLQPVSPYGAAKISAELYLHFYFKAHKLDYTVLRYSNVYGPGQDPLGEAGVVAIFTNAMLKKEPVTIYGNGSQTRDYVYVDDVVEANVLSLNAGSGEVFNIGTGMETSVQDLAEMLSKATSYDKPFKYVKPRAGEQERSVIDPAKASKILNWSASVSMEEGIKRTVEFFREKSDQESIDPKNC